MRLRKPSDMVQKQAEAAWEQKASLGCCSNFARVQTERSNSARDLT